MERDCLLHRLRRRRLTLNTHALRRARQEERERIARDLHDTLLQGVSALGLYLQGAAELAPAGSILRTRIEHALSRTAELLEEGRDRVAELRMSPGLGGDLADLLKDRCAQLEELFPRPAWRIGTEGAPVPLNRVFVEDAYRIAGEALLNAFRHSKPEHVSVLLQYGARYFRLVIRDDGTGVSPAMLEESGVQRRFGIAGMRERAERVGGRIEWSSCAPGTQVLLTVPAERAYDRTRDETRP